MAEPSDFDALYARTVPAIVAWCRLRLSGHANMETEIEEIVQETWERALQNFSRFDAQKSNFRSWLIGIAQMVLLETLRRNARLREELGPELHHGSGSTTSVTRTAMRDEGFRRMLAAIDAQPPEDRLLLLMHGLEARPLGEVAQRLGVSEDAAQKRWQRLCARLREHPAFADLMIE